MPWKNDDDGNLAGNLHATRSEAYLKSRKREVASIRPVAAVESSSIATSIIDSSLHETTALRNIISYNQYHISFGSSLAPSPVVLMARISRDTFYEYFSFLFTSIKLLGSVFIPITLVYYVYSVNNDSKEAAFDGLRVFLAYMTILAAEAVIAPPVFMIIKLVQASRLPDNETIRVMTLSLCIWIVAALVSLRSAGIIAI